MASEVKILPGDYVLARDGEVYGAGGHYPSMVEWCGRLMDRYPESSVVLKNSEGKCVAYNYLPDVVGQLTERTE